MAARTRKVLLRDHENWRQRIQASMLINRLNDHIHGKLDKPLEASQVTAALGLLKKVAPDLAAVTHSGDQKNPVRFIIDSD